MRHVYSAALYLFMPVALLRLFWRGFGNSAYWSRLSERFGLGPPVSPRGDHSQTFWVHAVSVGEVQAALPLVRGLIERFPRARIVVSSTTPTGMERVQRALGPEVIHRYVPYDLPGAANRFLDRVEPSLAVIVETEIWPNLLHQCAVRNIPVVIANARLSARSAAGYRKVRSLMRDALSQVAAIAAQTAADAQRLVEIGARPEIVEITGSTKFDVTLSASVAEAGEVLRRLWGVDRSVWIAASTHEGEDDLVLDAFAAVKRSVADCLLVLVPRHPERFARSAALSRRRGHQVALRSDGEKHCQAIDVFVGDTMGELPVFYAASDVAFVGGSLVDVGGHNMLEPAALGLPVVLGPYLHNFSEISERLCEEGAASIVHDSCELGRAVIRLLKDANLRHHSGERGRDFVHRSRGAGERHLEIIERALRRSADGAARMA